MNEAFDPPRPTGKALKNPAVGAPTLVTLTATAVASALTPDGSATVIWPPGASAAPPCARVSSSRVGETGSKRPAVGGRRRGERAGDVDDEVGRHVRVHVDRSTGADRHDAGVGRVVPGLEVEDRRLRPRRPSRVHRHEPGARRRGGGDGDGGRRDPGGDPVAAGDLDPDRGRVDRRAPAHRLPGCRRGATDRPARIATANRRSAARLLAATCAGGVAAIGTSATVESTVMHDQRRCEGPYPGHERSGYGEASATRRVP